MKTNTFRAQQESSAVAWKLRSDALPDEAREPAPWITQEGAPRGRYDYCLPSAYAGHNLLPEVRAGAIDLFRELGIPWHAGIDGGPGNHLLSSQVQCVNALFAMVADPARVRAAFGHLVDIAEVLQIEPGRHLTFEYIGPTDYFGEGNGRPRTRGSMCTSVDAAFLYRTSTGEVELALVEWKYTESYLETRKRNPAYDKTRASRYGSDFLAAEGPVRSDRFDLELLLDEPFYQLMRQQLLAHRLERDGAEGASTVRVLHILDPGNEAYQQSLVRQEARALGSTVDEVWRQLLVARDRFVHVDPFVFLNPKVTSDGYVDRYERSRHLPARDESR
jgi:hypothetical protein